MNNILLLIDQHSWFGATAKILLDSVPTIQSGTIRELIADRNNQIYFICTLGIENKVLHTRITPTLLLLLNPSLPELAFYCKKELNSHQKLLVDVIRTHVLRDLSLLHNAKAKLFVSKENTSVDPKNERAKYRSRRREKR